MNPKLSIIIVSLNVRELLHANLMRLLSLSEEVTAEIFVVDNASQDGTVEMVRKEFPQLHCIANDRNTGFGYACNQGMREAKGDVILLLNPDMLVEAGALAHTVQTLESRQDMGVMGIHLLTKDGLTMPSVRRNPSFLDQLAIISKVAKLFPQVLNHYLATDFTYEISQTTEQVRGSFFAFRRDVYEKVGEFDSKRFFVWFEEVDYCMRAKKAGYIIWYSAEATAQDYVGRTFVQQGAFIKQVRFSRSMVRYFAKWHPQWQVVILALFVPWALFTGALANLISLCKRK
jgi:GT2 family glycosyltransferase